MATICGQKITGGHAKNAVFAAYLFDFAGGKSYKTFP
jgi:hypothetical protein